MHEMEIVTLYAAHVISRVDNAPLQAPKIPDKDR